MCGCDFRKGQVMRQVKMYLLDKTWSPHDHVLHWIEVKNRGLRLETRTISSARRRRTRVEPGKCPSSRLQVHRRRAQNANVFLRHQLNIALRSAPPRLRLYSYNRALLIGMTRLWPGLLGMAQVVQPETILRWHRAGFKPFWRWKSRNRVGRPKIDRGLRDLIQRMSSENPLWGASLSF